MSKDIYETIDNVFSRSSIVFLGAGFSYGASIECSNFQEKKIPSSEAAKKMLAQSINFNENIKDASLADIAELVKDRTEDEIEFQQLMCSFFLKNFTLSIPSDAQKAISKLPWRSIFTTNYDDVIERCSCENKFEYYSPRSDNLDVLTGKTPVYYLHGRASDLSINNSLKGFILSESDYLNIPKTNDKLYNRLFGDVHAANEIVFIGYSLRDLEIASKFFSIKSMSQKVSIIISPEASELDILRLKKFGTVFNIGIEDFVKKLEEYSNTCNKSFENETSFLKPLKIKNIKNDVNANDFSSLILTGEFNNSAYLAQLSASDNHDFSEYYCLDKRKDINKILLDASKGLYNKFLIAADLGNGKSIFLKQLAVFAAKYYNYDVYEIKTQVNDIYTDIDNIIAGRRPSIFLIDGFVRYRNIITYISSRMGDKNVLVVTDPETIEGYAGDNNSDGFSECAQIIDINKLDENEIYEWNAILERWGLWEDRIKLGERERIEFIKKRCSSENRSLIVSLFKLSNISVKINTLVNSFVDNNNDYEQGLIAILIRALCHQHVQWSHIVSWLDLNENDIHERIKRSEFISLTERGRSWHEVTSPELAGYILNNFEFNAEKIIDSYCRIVIGTAHLSKDRRNGYDSKENLKELMRYRFLTRLFYKNNNQQEYISSVYQRLSKKKIIREKELFWLQWSMARLDLNDINNAESYLKTAKGLADKYHKDQALIQINDQFARLYFKKNTKKDVKINDEEISKAIEIISSAIKRRSEMLIYPMRSAVLIYDFLEEKSDEISVDMVKNMKLLVTQMFNLIKEKDLERSKKNENYQLRTTLSKILLLLEHI